MNKVLILATLVSLALLSTLAHTQGGPPPQPSGGGNISACSTAAPGGDPSVKISGRNVGAITVTSVTINGFVVDPSKYTVTNDGSSSPEVTFHAPDPGAPAIGATVCVYGTTTQGDSEVTGTLKWD